MIFTFGVLPFTDEKYDVPCNRPRIELAQVILFNETQILSTLEMFKHF